MQSSMQEFVNLRRDEAFPTYEAVEGDIGGMSHLRVKYRLQLL